MRIKQTLEKVLDKNTSLAEKNCTLFREQGHNYFLNTDCPFDNSTIEFAVTGVFERGGGAGGPPSKDEGVLNKLLNRLADALKRFAGKAVEALPAIVGSVVGTILSFFRQGCWICC